ncbi:PilZ domain-containing protein [Ruminiclostridium sufflavum DSM 19573]|uniref:PilZ domain-containing protein n=1 Tax=Ruminiclostridium sufflavum DSM 19573 TaxID=1121337 RepID=A0A318XL84_9FIRM|nr:PilZ domain-containing protein [Ruminiclostridium sufflavum]PYG85854.1 PilZ domain-containing protein [Ruminiclostridium sufflavum DSM 19573]
MQKMNLVLRHYNKLKPINCTVVSGDINKLFTVRFDELECKEAHFLKGDPVLIGILFNQENFQINGGSVAAATQYGDQYIICSNDVEFLAKDNEKREFDRYPTSLLADIKKIGGKREAACIKDISYSGMCIFSTGDFEIEDNVDINLYFSNNVWTFEAMIIRKTKNFGRNEYGVQIVHRDKNAMYAAQSQVAALVQNEKEIMYRHFSSLHFKI